MTSDEVRQGLQHTIEQYGEYTYDIPLPYGIWTRGNEGVPHTRLRRILQIAADLSNKPLESCRVLDLGSLDGQFSIEFALHGAQVIGAEIRTSNVQRAEFAKNAIGLPNLEFIQQDVRKISREQYGGFDIIICSGILYHLATPDVFEFTDELYDLCDRLLIIDTHISLAPSIQSAYKGQTYFGSSYFEHFETDAQEVKERRTLSSFDNNTSFWFTRPSLVNLMDNVGFSSVYECFVPPHLNYGMDGVEHEDRCTFVAIKQQQADLKTSLVANDIQEQYREGSLSYCMEPEAVQTRTLAAEQELQAMRGSRSWRLTAPLRACQRLLKR